MVQAVEPPAYLSGDEREIKTRARADALADIASGHPQICFTGGIAAFPMGVPEKYFDAIKQFPKIPLPAGCTEPLLGVASIYANAYNTEIVHYLDSKHR